jgi:hypothetical protein
VRTTDDNWEVPPVIAGVGVGCRLGDALPPELEEPALQPAATTTATTAATSRDQGKGRIAFDDVTPPRRRFSNPVRPVVTHH